MHFTLKQYKQLLTSLIDAGYNFKTFAQALQTGFDNTIVLRHDVDKLPYNSLAFAKIQHGLGVVGSYNFRSVPCSWNQQVIKEIASLGHEVGYHYENLTTHNGDLERGIADFEHNLTELRKLAPVTTICMHGSPASKWDSRDLWKKYKYQDFGIIGEPYFDVNFDNVFYLTDTGRRWDGHKVSVRDKVPQQQQWNQQGLSFHTANQIIDAVNNKQLPKNIMFTFHPQRWTDNPVLWLKELLLQRAKNIVKSTFFVTKPKTFNENE